MDGGILDGSIILFLAHELHLSLRLSYDVAFK